MDFSKEHVFVSLRKLAEKHGLTKYQIDFLPGATKGDNYLGVVYKVSIKEEEEKIEKKELKLFCKVPPESEKVRQDFTINDMFAREVFMLSEVIPRYKKLEEEIRIINGFESYPKLLASSTVDLKEYLVMNDLSEEGYEMLDVTSYKQGIDVEYLHVVLQAIGKLHALGLALKAKHPEILQGYQRNAKEVFMKSKRNEGLHQFFEMFLKGAVEVLKFDEEKYESAWINFHENYYKHFYVVDGELAEPYAVLNHGDLWNNNMMFKCKNGVPESVRFVDWQLSRYCSPVLDPMYYIFLNTTKSYRSLHYKTLLNTYYNSVSGSLSQLGFEPEKLFPYSAFQDHLVKFGRFCLVMGIFQPLMYQTKSNAQDLAELLDDSPQITSDVSECGPYSKLHGILTDMVDLGYL